MQKILFDKSDLKENTEFWKINSEEGYVKCIQNIITSRPFGDHKFYIHSFIKRVDDSSGIKKMYHHPRLTKPEPTPGSTLMRVDPKDPGTAIILWTLPNQENFSLYKYGKLYADKFVHECIERFCNNPGAMCDPEPDDLSDDQIREIYRGMKKKTAG